MESATPDQPIALGNVDGGIVLDEAILGPVLEILENCGLLMDIPERRSAKRAAWRELAEAEGIENL